LRDHPVVAGLDIAFALGEGPAQAVELAL